MTPFFVPGASADEAEATYGALVGRFDLAVPTLDQRIYKLTFTESGEVWTAEVGQRLRGERTKTVRRQGRTTERTVKVSNEALVLAIIPSRQIHVITDRRPIGDLSPLPWNNPIYVLEHEVESVELFETPTAD